MRDCYEGRDRDGFLPLEFYGDQISHIIFFPVYFFFRKFQLNG